MQLKNYLLISLLLLLSMFMLFSCTDDDGNNDIDEFANWQVRNNDYLKLIHDEALCAIGQGGNEWKTFLNFHLNESSKNTINDSIYVKVVKEGEGSAVLHSTDSVKVYYYARLIPSVSYPKGKMIAHSGQSTRVDDIFNKDLSVPTSLDIPSQRDGLSTALQRMHIGDRWIIYVPYSLAFETNSFTIGSVVVPGYSTIIYEVELLSCNH